MGKHARVPGFPIRERARIWQGLVPGTHEPGFVEQALVEFRPPEELRALTHGDLDLPLHCFHMGECKIILGREPCNNGPLRWHLSISCPQRHPSWDEIKTARYRLLGPDMAVAMILPPPEHYVNVESQDHVFQLYELLDGEAYDAWVMTS